MFVSSQLANLLLQLFLAWFLYLSIILVCWLLIRRYLI